MFTTRLKRMHYLNLPAFFEVAEMPCLGRIAAVMDEEVLVEIEQNDKIVFLLKHITSIEFIKPPTLSN
ncbi:MULTISPECIES: hypothetical protein [Pseudomonas fluorescens group]|jgi:hypothetical protein|uniref:hypothetical protein n=1 Tax=Pseudomonas fluorescens group TaxID=136843 RepID=UPI00114791CC|nr:MULTISPECIES: hypothetical protein [Pseudomonas fluorescens group]QDH62756.1 hypothetical protein FKZ69_01725 [Pseudomonas azotoformans]QDH63669.1 hypothetical protein FKZ69_06555 [Pseudomonas azotoformans]